MSAQDARVVDAIRKGIDTGTDALAGILPVTDATWQFFRTDVKAAIEKGIRAALDAMGIASGHVQINGGPDVRVGFEVLPPEPKP